MGYQFGKRSLVGDHLIMNNTGFLIPLPELYPLLVDTLKPFPVQDVLGVGYVPGILKKSVKVNLALAQGYLSISPQSFKYPAQPEPLELPVQPVLMEVKEVKSLDQVMQVEYGTEDTVRCQGQYPFIIIIRGGMTGEFHHPVTVMLGYLSQVGVSIDQVLSMHPLSRVFPEGEATGEVHSVTLKFTIVKNHPVGDSDCEQLTSPAPAEYPPLIPLALMGPHDLSTPVDPGTLGEPSTIEGHGTELKLLHVEGVFNGPHWVALAAGLSSLDLPQVVGIELPYDIQIAQTWIVITEGTGSPDPFGNPGNTVSKLKCDIFVGHTDLRDTYPIKGWYPPYPPTKGYPWEVCAKPPPPTAFVELSNDNWRWW